jgi:acetolactate synthase-1/2/3 large subunit
MAWDVMGASAPVGSGPGAQILPAEVPRPADVEAAARLIVAAERPMIMTGSGAQQANGAVRALAEELAAPVAAFRGGRGVLAEDHQLAISSYAAFRLWPQTDVLIGIGTRLEMPYMRWTGMMTLIDRPAPPPHLIRIDIDAAELGRLVPHVGIVADAEAGTTALLAAVRTATADKPGKARGAWRASIQRAKAEARAEIEKVQPQLAYLDVIRELLPRDGFLVPELSQVGFTSYFGYHVYAPRTYVSEGYQGTLGFGFPTALGVKIAHPDRVVMSITGDGGFMFAAAELATAVQERIGLVTLLFNNQAYGNVLRDQRTTFANRINGALLDNPDFMLLAKAFGVEAHRVGSPAELRPVLARAIGVEAPVLIEVVVAQGSEVSPWEFIHPKR